MDHREVFLPLNEAIKQSCGDRLDHIEGGATPKWYGHALSDIVLALGPGEPFELADASVEYGEGDAYRATIRVFAGDVLVEVQAQSDGQVGNHTTTVRARRSLRSLDVSASASALGDSWPAYWPGRVELQLTFDDGTRVSLPCAASNRVPPAQHERIAALLPSLRRDLVS